MDQFPSDRFRRAGATDNEVKVLEADFDAKPPVAQQQQLEQLAAISENDIRSILDASRTETVEPTVDVVPVDGVPVETANPAGDAFADLAKK